MAQTGFNFLDISSDARASAMAGAVNSLSGYSEALFHNPSSMADIPTMLNANFSINKWIADINHISASLIYFSSEGDYGVFGLSLQSVDYGDIHGTVFTRDNEQSYFDTGLLNPTAMAFGIGYAVMLNDKFSVGTQVKYAFQKLGNNVFDDGSIKNNETSSLALDFGTIYRTGIKSLAFGMSVRNYSNEVKYEKESFQLPLIFIIGISADLFDFFEIDNHDQTLLLSIDATHHRSHPEQIIVGIEYSIFKSIFLRGGYVSANSEDDFSFGLGLSYYGAFIDYAYTPFGVFNNVQRFTVRVSL
ncbi:MAG: PorV/PorQ family protein [Ignavibacteriales bacterium]|nr:PorV/PorQ family protein [Ignavibacteriales bacterium]